MIRVRLNSKATKCLVKVGLFMSVSAGRLLAHGDVNCDGAIIARIKIRISRAAN